MSPPPYCACAPPMVRGKGRRWCSRPRRRRRSWDGSQGRTVVGVAAPEVGGLGQRGQGAVEAGDEAVVVSAADASGPPRRAGKVGATGVASHVDVTGRGVDREGPRGLAAPPEIGGLGECGQRAREPDDEAVSVPAADCACAPPGRRRRCCWPSQPRRRRRSWGGSQGRSLPRCHFPRGRWTGGARSGGW